jgi:PAS domain-containing protein
LAGLQRQLLVLLAVAALAILGLAVASLILVIAAGGADWTVALPAGLAFLGLVFLWQAWSVARLPRLGDEAAPDIQSLHAALAALDARYAQERATPDDRLQAVLASIPDAMLVITDEGQVTLVNHAAKALLGAERGRRGQLRLCRPQPDHGAIRLGSCPPGRQPGRRHDRHPGGAPAGRQGRQPPGTRRGRYHHPGGGN